MKLIKYSILIFLSLLVITGCCSEKDQRSMVVTASAYNSHRYQTQGDPTVTAWGDKLIPGLQAIAVSRDLIREGLTHGIRVKIEGLSGEYIVMDKMNRRFRETIDIYMGNDIEEARKWGRHKVTITWFVEEK